jgi:hypothetical protein
MATNPPVRFDSGNSSLEEDVWRWAIDNESVSDDRDAIR